MEKRAFPQGQTANSEQAPKELYKLCGAGQVSRGRPEILPSKLKFDFPGVRDLF